MTVPVGGRRDRYRGAVCCGVPWAAVRGREGVSVSWHISHSLLSVQYILQYVFFFLLFFPAHEEVVAGAGESERSNARAKVSAAGVQCPCGNQAPARPHDVFSMRSRGHLT